MPPRPSSPGKEPRKAALRLRLGGGAADGPLPEGAHIGVDEAGRGCLAGPVVAGAVLFPESLNLAEALPGLGDSKKLNATQRSRLASQITERALAYGIGLAWQDEIDSVNILNATFRAMSRAVLALSARLQERRKELRALPHLVIDGNKTIPDGQWRFCAQGIPAAALAWEQYFSLPLTLQPVRVPELPEQRAVVGGDALVPAVSAASILAKTVRDGIMTRLDEFFPGYALAAHKGYGTRVHLAALAEKGPCRLHRRTFRGVLPTEDDTPTERRLALFS